MRKQNQELEMSSSKDNPNATLIKLDMIKQLNDPKNVLVTHKSMNHNPNKKINHNKTFIEDQEDDALVKDAEIFRKLSVRDKIVTINNIVYY